MQIEKTFLVKASPAAVWGFLIDPHRVARCLPGAAITEQIDDQTYAGTITVKVGPVSASYKGRVRFEHLDAALWSAEIVASGQDIRGKGGADMRMRSRLVGKAPGETEVVATSEVNVTGILAQFGRGMIQDVSDQMFQKFTEAVRAELETKAQTPVGPDPAPAVEAPQTPPIDAVSFGAGVLGRALGRAVRGPALWVTAAALALLVYWLWFR